jgi:hypothetical protein
MLIFLPTVSEQILEFLRFNLMTANDELSGPRSVDGDVEWDADLVSFWESVDYERFGEIVKDVYIQVVG